MGSTNGVGALRGQRHIYPSKIEPITPRVQELPARFSATCLQQMQSSVVEGLNKTDWNQDQGARSYSQQVRYSCSSLSKLNYILKWNIFKDSISRPIHFNCTVSLTWLVVQFLFYTCTSQPEAQIRFFWSSGYPGWQKRNKKELKQTCTCITLKAMLHWWTIHAFF